MPFYYLKRVQRNVSLCHQHDLLKPDDRVLELGTGWVHWEALSLRLFFDFKATLYDVWDNRQWQAVKSYLRRLSNQLVEENLLPRFDVGSARNLIKRVCEMEFLEEMYDLLGFQYIVDPDGMMRSLPADSFGLILSAGVFEHIQRETADSYVKTMAKLLKKGGHCILSINMTDHLYHYDRAASPKQYLAYSDRTWRLLFENRLQYINRLQRPEWLSMFADGGLQLVEEDGACADLRELNLNAKYKRFPKRDLECTTLNVLLRKR